jgi:hypothetical protein
MFIPGSADVSGAYTTPVAFPNAFSIACNTDAASTERCRWSTLEQGKRSRGCGEPYFRHVARALSATCLEAWRSVSAVWRRADTADGLIDK